MKKQSSRLQDKIREITEELQELFLERTKLVDAIIPPLVFLLVNLRLGFQAAIIAALLIEIFVAGIRLKRGESLIYVSGGLLGIILAVLLARASGRPSVYFLPSIISQAAVLVTALFSISFRKPLVAWASHFTRDWPLDWYFHPKVRPAYQEVTWLWVFYLSLQLALQIFFFQKQALSSLVLFNFFRGWPATVVLLVVSYLYGTWRLKNLKSPSVEEFKKGTKPPWKGQQRGF